MSYPLQHEAVEPRLEVLERTFWPMNWIRKDEILGY